MAVGAPIGTLGLVWIPAGVWTPEGWPAGTQAGHTVIARCSRYDQQSALGPRQSTWHVVSGDLWWIRLTAADLAAGPGVWDGQLVGMVTLPGARGIGATSGDRGVRLSEAGGGMLVYAWSGRWSGDHLGWPEAGLLGTDIEIRDRQWVCWWLRTYALAGTYRIERDGDAVGYRAFEILPAKQPDPPLITAPTQGTHLDVAQDVAVTIAHQSLSELQQEARRVRVRELSSPTWSHVRSDGSLDAAVQTVTTSSGEVGIDAGQLAAGSYEVQAATMDGGAWSDWSPSTMFVFEQAPSVVVTLATVFGRLTASGSWVPTTPGGVQTAWQAAVVPAGGSVADALLVSPVQAGAGVAWTIPALSWVKGGSYELLVWVEQTGGLRSPWTRSNAATVDWTAPAAPSAIVGVDGVPLDLVVTGVPAAAIALSIEWASAHADDWTALAMVEGPSASTQVEVALAPYGVPRRYRARAWQAIDGVWLPSVWVMTSAAVASTDEHARLVDADDPTDWIAVTVQDDDGWTVEQGITVTYPLMPEGSTEEARPAIDRTPPAGRSGTLGLLCTSETDVDQVIDWVTRVKRRWITRWSPEHDPSRTMRDRTPTVMGLADRVKISRPIQRRLAVRIATIPWVEQ